ncbi:hypothetical protein ACER0C_031664 [Sarotherodon galilaeus]
MKIELQDLGLWPWSRPVRHPGNAISLWGLPPQPELIDTVADLPSPNFFQLHSFFIWKPESAIMIRLRNNYILPCLRGCFRPQVVSAGVYQPSPCFSDVQKGHLPMDELRWTGKSPADMANQINELMHLKYKRAHLAYLHAIESVWDSEAGAHGERTIGQFLRKENKPQEFRSYEDPHAWCGVSVSSHYLTDCLLDEFRRQHPAISKLLQGTFGHIVRSDHTRKVAQKVTPASGVMSSYSIMNENWLIVSWVMVQSETERSLEPMYQGMAKRYSDAGVEKASYHWVDR